MSILCTPVAVDAEDILKKPRRRDNTKKYRPHGSRWQKRIVAVDGEGWGIDEHGRQLYRLMGAADNHGNTWVLRESQPGEGLRTEDVFNWFRDILPHDGLFTSYYFGYDVAHILIDWELDKLTELYDRESRQSIGNGEFNKRKVEWQGWRIDWLPTKQFTVRSKGIITCVWDASSYFQKSFVAAITDSKLFTDDEIEFIRKGKQRRGDEDGHIFEEEVAYCLAECKALSRLVHNLLETAEATGMAQQDYYGPGSLARVSLKRHKVNTYKNIDPLIEDIAERAYVGGRFEETGHGKRGLLYEYDINSAYPSALINLPCFAHGTWKHTQKPEVTSPIALVHVSWEVDKEFSGGWGPYPVRQESGMPHWPYKGHAWVWSWEYEAGLKLPGAWWVSVIEAYEWIPECDHEPFSFISDLYAERKKYKDGREKIIKLALNSMYGKLAQRVGTSPYKSMSWAGMITSHTRAQLLKAIALNPNAVVATATDAILSTEPLNLDIGDKLGQWSEPLELYDCLLIQPGFYTARSTSDTAKYPKGKHRTRGIPASYIDWNKYWELFDKLYDLDWTKVQPEDVTVPLSLTRHIGVGLTVHYGDVRRLGKWEETTHNIRFFSYKRPRQIWYDRDWITTEPISDAHDGNITPLRYEPGFWNTEVKELRAEIRDSIDWVYAFD